MSKITYYRLQNEEQRGEIDRLNAIIYRLQKADLEKTESLINVFRTIVELTKTNNIYKIIKIQDLAQQTEKELLQEIEDVMFIPNDEEGKIIELPATN